MSTAFSRIVAALLLAAATNSVVDAAEPARTARPNILWISCEDISPHLGCYGDRHAITPNLDRLAADGVRYTHAFSVAGVCAPSRSSIITAMYPTTIGSQHMRSKITLSPPLRCFTEYLRDAGYYCTNNSKTDYNFDVPPNAWDETSRKAHWKHRAAGQPFFAVFNLTVTHESQVRADDEAHAKNTSHLTNGQRQDPQKLSLPPYYPDTPIVRKDWAHYYELVTAMDVRAGELLHELTDAGLDDETIVFFFSDHGVGLPRAKRWLYDSGIHVPLIIRWPGKLQAKTEENRLVSLLDLGPTVMSIAGVPVPEHMQGRAFLGDAAVAPREYVYAARDRMDERYDVIRAVRDRRYKYLRNFCPDLPYAQHLQYAEAGRTMQEIRRLQAEGKLTGAPAGFVAERKPVEEFYDLDADPHELNNLAESAEHRAALDRLRVAHERWSNETRDSGLLPEPELESLAGTNGIYPVLLAGEYDATLRRIRYVAAMSAQVDIGFRSQLLEASSDAEPAVRYWAIRGLVPFARKSKAAYAQLVKLATGDSSPSVRVAAAQGLYANAGEETGLRVLAAELQSDRPSVRLLAANAIDNCGKWGRDNDPRAKLRPQLTAALRDKNQYVVRVAERLLQELAAGNEAEKDRTR